MQYYTEPISRLIEEFSKLPGIGKKTAQRLAFHVINMNNNDVEALSKAILDAKKEIKYCSICCNITDKDPCSMCSNPNRDSSVICVVEDPRDVAAMEKIREFKGQYHVLNGWYRSRYYKYKRTYTKTWKSRCKRNNYGNKPNYRRRSYSYVYS